MCTSCEQKVDASSANVDTLADDLDKVDLSYDNELFQDPPPREECPICMLPMPHALAACGVEASYMPCCGKTICAGCTMVTMEETEKGNLKDLCPLCRVPAPKSDEELMKRCKKRMQLNDANAFHAMGQQHYLGDWGLPRNAKKAIQLWTKGAELGSCNAHSSLGDQYLIGNRYHEGVEEDPGKAAYHLAIASMGGHEVARYHLGMMDTVIDKMERAMKHFMIAASSGYDKALKKVGEGYKAGHVTKDEYASTLRAYQDSQNEMKSVQRTKAQRQAENERQEMGRSENESEKFRYRKEFDCEVRR